MATELLGEMAQLLRVGSGLSAERGVLARREQEGPFSLAGRAKRHLPGLRRHVEQLVDEERPGGPDLSHDGERIEGSEPVLSRPCRGVRHRPLESAVPLKPSAESSRAWPPRRPGPRWIGPP